MSATGTSKRLNYTHRHRIKRDWVTTSISPGDPLPLLSASVDLSYLELPPEAKLRLEVSRRTRLERYDLGTVAAPCPLTEQPLDAFADPDGVLVRIKVIGVGTGDAGRLLAVADKIRPVFTDSSEVGGRPLLRFRSDDGLGQIPWALDLADDDPVVLMNDRLGDWNAAARSESFVALVYPEILRQIARWVGDTVAGGDELEGPVADWARFLTQLGHDPTALGPDPDPESIADWAAGVSSRFASVHRLTDRAASVLVGEDG